MSTENVKINEVVPTENILSEVTVAESIAIDAVPITETNTCKEIVVKALTVDESATSQSSTKTMLPPPKPNLEQWRFRPADYLRKLPIEEAAEKMITENPEQEESIMTALKEKKKDFFGIEFERNREILNANIFAHSLDSVLYSRIFASHLFLYNHYRGLYVKITDDEFHAITKPLLDDLSLSIWKKSKQSEYTDAFKLNTHAKQGYSQYDYDMRYIAFTNGTLNVLTGELLPHSPSFNCTNAINYEYDETATCPLFEETLNIIFQSDQELIASFQDMFGSFLMHGEGDAIDRFYVFLGGGSNGKSLLCKVITHVLSPENCSAKPLADLGKPFAMASVYQKMLNISTEEKRNVIDTEIIKSITSSDPVSVNQKYEKEFKAVPHVKLLCCANHLPTFNDDSDGLLRRIQVFPFNVRFVDEPTADNPLEYAKDPTLERRLLKERAGILRWALVGTKRVYENGMNVSRASASKEFLKRIKAENNPVQVFTESCLGHANGNKIRTKEVFNHYEKWLSRHHIENRKYSNPQSFHKEFKTQLEFNGFSTTVKSINGRDHYYDFDIDWNYPLNPKINY